ncbi:MAG: NAD(P)-dependent oxidoreductase, partial [bacterium]|nr:NAD(P)-dependent oxidoreductase [bacterium]
YKPLDITDKEQVNNLDTDVECIFLFSGLTGTSVGFKNYDDFVRVNELGLLNLLDQLKESGSRARVVFPSSRLVYKGRKDQKLLESDEKEFKTIYASNKFACENYLEMYRRCFGIDYTVFRICVPYGNLLGGYSYGTMGFLLGRARKGQDIPLYGDGSQKRTFSHIGDICGIIQAASFMTETKNSVFNIGSRDHLSLLEVAGLVAKKYGVGVTFAPWPDMDLAIESGDTMFDSGKLDRLTRYIYRYTITDWLESIE